MDQPISEKFAKSTRFACFVVFIALTALHISSCKPVMKKLYGIKNPEVENEKSIVRKALKFGLDTAGIVTADHEHFLFVLDKYGIPDGSIYDSNGRYIEYRSTDTSCNAGLFDFIPALTRNGKYNQPDHISLSEEMAQYRDLRGELLPALPKADYYLLLYWTVWTGKLNKDHVKIWEEQAKANQNCHIHVVKVNLDFQEYWSEADREKIIGKLKKPSK